jgi:hypothetical protein
MNTDPARPEKPRFARDMDVVRKILFWAEAGAPASQVPERNTAEWLQWLYHCQIMREAGLIDGKIEIKENYSASGPYYTGTCSIKWLTWQGHEFLEACRSEITWKKVKEVFARHGVPFIREILVSVVKMVVRQGTGLDLQ